MKTKFISIVIVFLCFNASLYSQETLDFSLTNNTGVDLLYIQVSENNKNSWGQDVIPNDLFLNGDTYIISVPIYSDTICLHDLKVTDVEGAYAYLTGADVCVYKYITLYFDENGVLTWQMR